MLLIIDGYNLIFANHNLPSTPKSLEKARRNLIQMLGQYNHKKQRKYQIIIVFDGRDQVISKQVEQEAGTPIEIIFSPNDLTADMVIKDLAAKNKHQKNITVITSDNELNQHLQPAGVYTIKSLDFIDEVKKTIGIPPYTKEQITEPKEKITGVNDEHQVRAWLELFGFTEKDSKK
ncbi:MAG: NYN domain-containing protein [Planctomycetes bacterium]|nr:NYN domain-containing protein [Planctomycetota bacterium]